METKRGRKPEPKFAVVLSEIPDPPAFLSKVAKSKWKSLTVLLNEAGQLSRLDIDQLAIYCANYADYLLARQDVEARGLVVTGNNGYECPNPSLKISVECQRLMKACADTFGLNPRARTKLVVLEAEEPVDPKWEDD